MNTKEGTTNPAVRDRQLTTRGGCRGCATGPGSSAPRGLLADDVNFKADNFSFKVEGEPGERGFYSPGASRAASRELGKFPVSTGKAMLLLGSCLLLVVAGSAWFVADSLHSDGYTSEIKLLYLPVGDGAKNTPTWPLEKEVALLRSGELFFRVAAELCSRYTSGSLNGYDRAAGAGSLQRFGNPDELARWLSERLVAEPEISGDTAKVTLRLAGDDPRFLAKILEVYFRKYEEYRQTLGEEGHTQLAPVSQVSTEPDEVVQVEAISEQLKKVELQAQNCALSLQLMDSQKGSFGGFVPDGSLGDASSLSRFQERIVELEIKKRGMAVQYTPNSKELRAIDQEIAGVRSAMRECLVEYLRFLNKGKEALAAHKAQIVRKKSLSKIEGPRVKPGRCSGQLPNGDAWFLANDGLYVFRDKASVSAIPLLTRASRYKDVVLAGLFPSVQSAAALVSSMGESKLPDLNQASWEQTASRAGSSTLIRPIQSGRGPRAINFDRACRSAVPARTVKFRISSGDATAPEATLSESVRSGHGR